MEPNKSYFVARIEDLKMLCIHDSFVKNIPKNIFMMKIIEGGGGGSCWDVVVKRTRDDGMFLEDGWNEFLRVRLLGFGDILVFHYDGSTKLEVMRLITSSTMGQIESVMAAYYFQELKKQESWKTSASSNLERNLRNARVTEFIMKKYKKFCNGAFPNAERFRDYAENRETDYIKHVAKNNKRRFRSDCRRAYSQRSFVPATRNAEKTPDPADSWDGQTNGVDTSEKIESEHSAENDLAKHVAKNYKVYADHPRAYAGNAKRFRDYAEKWETGCIKHVTKNSKRFRGDCRRAYSQCSFVPATRNAEKTPDPADSWDGQTNGVDTSEKIESERSAENDLAKHVAKNYKVYADHPRDYAGNAERIRDYAEKWETGCIKHVTKNSKRFRSDCRRACSQCSFVPATRNAEKTPDPADSWDGQTNGVDTSEKIESERSEENDLAKHVAKNYKVYADHPRAYAGNAERISDYAEKWETGCIKHVTKNSKRFRSDCRRAYSQCSFVPATRNAEKTPDPADSWGGQTNGVDASEKIASETSAENNLAKHVAKNYKMYADHPRAYAGCNSGPVTQNVERTPDTAENFDQDDSEVNPSGQIVSDDSEKNVVFQDNKQVHGVDTSSKKMSKNLKDDVVFQDNYRNYDVDTSERGVVFEENWQNDLYRRICLRYGRLEGSQVVEKTNDMLILTLKEILNVAMALESVDVDTLLPGTLQSWENTIEVGELFKFNVSWLRNLVNEVKALFSSHQSLEEDVAIRNACESLSKLNEKVELAKKDLEALVQAENDAKKALGEAFTRLKSATIFRLNI